MMWEPDDDRWLFVAAVSYGLLGLAIGLGVIAHGCGQ